MRRSLSPNTLPTTSWFRTRLTVGSLVLVALTSPAAAQATDVTAPAAHRVYGAWRSSALGGGGFVPGAVFAASDPKRCYGWTDVGGFHRSDDGGQTWHALHGNLPGRTDKAHHYVRGLSVDPRNADRLLVAVGSRWEDRAGVFASDDGGRTFRNTLPALFNGDDPGRGDGAVFARDPSNADRVLVGSLRDGLFESRDNGQTWRNLGLKETAPIDVIIDRADPQRMFVCAGRYREWIAPQYSNDPDPGLARLTLAGGLWASDDGGATWAKRSDDAFKEIVQDARDPATFYAIVGHAVVRRSTDGGRTWSDFIDGLPAKASNLTNPKFAPWDLVDDAFQSLAVGPDFVLVGSFRGTIHRLDAGATVWRRVERRNLVEPTSWWGSPAGAPRGGTYVHTGGYMSTVAVSPHDSSQWMMTDWFSLYRSPDAGATWVNSTDGIEVTYVQCLEQDPSPDGSVVHVGAADIGYFRSVDGGATFTGGTFARRGGITNNIKSISAPAADPSRVYATGPNPPGGGWYAGHVFVSDDRGVTWAPTPMTGLPRIAENAAHANTILASDARAGEVYLCVSGKVGAGSGGVFRSVDGARTWTFDGDGLPAGQPFYRPEIYLGGHELAIGPDGRAVTIGINVGRVFRRGAEPDARWAESSVTLGGKPNDVRADPHRPGRFYIAASEGGLWRSDDAGATWTKLALPGPSRGAWQITVDRRIAGRLAVSTTDGVFYSADGGDAWVELDRALPDRVKWNRGAFTGDRLVVGTGGSGLFWTDLPSPSPSPTPPAPAGK